MENVTDKHRYVAHCLNLNPSRPDTWPQETVERLSRLKERCDTLPPVVGTTNVGFPIRNPEKYAFHLEVAKLLGAY
jgi:hypothetical protein